MNLPIIEELEEMRDAIKASTEYLWRKNEVVTIDKAIILIDELEKRARAGKEVVDAAKELRNYGVELDDVRLRYKSVQIDRKDEERFDTAIAAYNSAVNV